jgi:ketosteroid isomerase-like protein
MSNHNQQLVQDFFASMSSGSMTACLAMLADDVSWLAPGKPEHIASAGTYDKTRLRGLFERMESTLAAPYTIRVTRVVAEGDQLAVEAEGAGTLKNGREYRQNYHFAIECAAGKISKVREYLDTHHIFETWYRAA